ncbi:interleukin-18 [Bombina bombina]|uniref:interleukin-18 n=1 Tax=Bombina bombina TaxID=8345 RepID=UPI00235AF066|nr:interleukin-18 [Bombina bombina]
MGKAKETCQPMSETGKATETSGTGEAGEANVNYILHRSSNDILVFEVSDLQTDTWRLASQPSINVLIKNQLNEFLRPSSKEISGGGADFSDVLGGVQFNLHKYKNTKFSPGLSVAFIIKANQKTYCMCCTEDMKISFKQQDCPQIIRGDTSDIIFYQKTFSRGTTNSFYFESALRPGYALACHEEDGKKKLVLKKSSDEPDRADETRKLDLVKN